jgi:hypothetical protein
MLYKFSRWPLYSYAPMRWRDRVMLPFAYVLFVVVLGVLHVAGAMTAEQGKSP